MSNIVEIGEFRISQKRRTYAGHECKHLRFTVEHEGEVVNCDDCGKQISSHWALMLLVETYQREMACLASARATQKSIEGKTIHLKAAQRVESAWRSRSMVPSCPHCREGIFPEDGFGGSAVSREIALRRREAKKGQS